MTRFKRRKAILRAGAPLFVLAVTVVAWEVFIRAAGVPSYILPSPSLIATTLLNDYPILLPSLLVTLETALLGFVLALIGGATLAVLLSFSRVFEYSVYPFAVALQVTPVVAIAPLLLIYLPQHAAVLVCAWIVAFFPVLSNTMFGLQSIDRNLKEMFMLYGSTHIELSTKETFRVQWKSFWLLRCPSALPSFLAGLRIASGLSLVGAVVAEMAAGSAGAGAGLAYRIVESQYRLNIPRLFAALILLVAAGIAIYGLTTFLSRKLLKRWHINS